MKFGLSKGKNREAQKHNFAVKWKGREKAKDSLKMI